MLGLFSSRLQEFPQHLTPYSLKYFLDFIGVLIYLFLPSQLSPLMFTMYYNLLKGFDNLPECAQSLATTFSLLFNFIPATSHFPTAWKIASEIPLHKSGSLHDVKNYRPISILPSLSNKVFEKLIHKHFTVVLKPTTCFIIAILDSVNTIPLHLIY